MSIYDAMRGYGFNQFSSNNPFGRTVVLPILGTNAAIQNDYHNTPHAWGAHGVIPVQQWGQSSPPLQAPMWGWPQQNTWQNSTTQNDMTTLLQLMLIQHMLKQQRQKNLGQRKAETSEGRSTENAPESRRQNTDDERPTFDALLNQSFDELQASQPQQNTESSTSAVSSNAGTEASTEGNTASISGSTSKSPYPLTPVLSHTSRISPEDARSDFNTKQQNGYYPFEETTNTIRFSPTANGKMITMHRGAYRAFLSLYYAARQDGVELVVNASHRTKAEQAKLTQRPDTKQYAAPAGYSEHHTGYVVDIDMNRPGVKAWMEKNAAQYGFELSYPPNNAQGVRPEPWHWRYVGSEDAAETFKVVRALKPKTQDDKPATN